MSFDFNKLLRGPKPAEISKKLIQHQVARFYSDIDGYGLISSIFKTEKYKKLAQIDELNSRYFPHLFEHIAPSIFPYWLHIFNKSWGRRYRSRWVKSSKHNSYRANDMHRQIPDVWIPAIERGDIPAFHKTVYENVGSNVLHFRRFLKYFIAGSEYHASFWPQRPDLADAFCSYCLPHHKNSPRFHHHNYHPNDAYDWPLTEGERNFASELRNSAINGVWPRISNASSKPTKFQKPMACLYLGIDTGSGRYYVGQTLNEAELRFLQHRKDRSGPYKNGSISVNWEIIEAEVEPAVLDYKEAYWIGFYDSYAQGFNDTKGNSPKGYKEGQLARLTYERSSPPRD